MRVCNWPTQIHPVNPLRSLSSLRWWGGGSHYFGVQSFPKILGVLKHFFKAFSAASFPRAVQGLAWNPTSVFDFLHSLKSKKVEKHIQLSFGWTDNVPAMPEAFFSFFPELACFCRDFFTKIYFCSIGDNLSGPNSFKAFQGILAIFF